VSIHDSLLNAVHTPHGHQVLACLAQCHVVVPNIASSAQVQSKAAEARFPNTSFSCDCHTRYIRCRHCGQHGCEPNNSWVGLLCSLRLFLSSTSCFLFESYFVAYFLGIVFVFTATQNKIHLLRWIYWIYDQYPILHTHNLTKMCGSTIIDLMTRLKCRSVCILVKTDEVCPSACIAIATSDLPMLTFCR
jgi:hypothetical protein